MEATSMRKNKVLTDEQIAKRKKVIRILKWVGLFLGIVLSAVVQYAGPEILQFWFEPNIAETIILLISIFLMVFIIYLILCAFLHLINKEKDSLEDKDTQQIYNDINIDKKERCIHYVDVCSISRALNREGMNIGLKEEDKKQYRIGSLEDIAIDFKDAKEIVIISEQNNDLVDLNQTTNKLLIDAINNTKDLVVKFLFVEKENREIEIEQFKSKMEKETKGSKGSFIVKEISDKKTMMGNTLLSVTKIILISKKDDQNSFFTAGYMKFYSVAGEEELYYKMPFCTLKNYAKFAIEYLNREVKVIKHHSTEDFKEFEFKPITSLNYYKDLCDINDDVKNENISVDMFSAPSNEELMESLDKDIVYGVFHHQKLVAFSILIEDRNSERDLSNYYPKYNKDTVISFDNVEVRKEYRGYGLEKELIEIAIKELKKRNRNHLLAVVSKTNIASFKSFEKCGFKVLRSDIPIYGSTRELVEYKIVK